MQRTSEISSAHNTEIGLYATKIEKKSLAPIKIEFISEGFLGKFLYN